MILTSFYILSAAPWYIEEKMSLGANLRTRYSFVQNKAGCVSGFHASAEDTIKEIWFEKVD